MVNILSIDVEDSIQAPSRELPPGDMAGLDIPDVERTVSLLLDLFAGHKATATFFVSGIVAEAAPHIVKKIQDRGHEIASHGYSHTPVYRRSQAEFEEDLIKSLNILKTITGRMPIGYRAPFWSITRASLWALPVLQKHGIRYDSSIYPTSNYLYGVPDAPREPYTVPGTGLTEFPGSTIRVCGMNVPFGGGAYLRGLPFCLTRSFMRDINKRGKPCMFYFHPHELSARPYPLPAWHRENIILSFGRKRLHRKIAALLSCGEFVSFSQYLDAAGRGGH